MLTEIRIAGFGGQGVILSAIIIGKAASIYRGRLRHHDAELRPGSARRRRRSAQVILSDEPILYPYVTQPDILVVMSQEAYTRFAPELKQGGMLIVEQDLVRVDRPAAGRARLRRSRHAPGRGTRPQDGAQHRDGRLLRAPSPNCSTPTALRQAVADSVPPAMQNSTCRPSTKASSTAPNWSAASPKSSRPSRCCSKPSRKRRISSVPDSPRNSVILPVEPQGRGNFHERGPSHWCGNPQCGSGGRHAGGRTGPQVSLLHDADARSRRPHRAQALPAGQDRGRRLRRPRPGSHPGRAARCWPSPDDVLFPSHRDMAVFLIRGVHAAPDLRPVHGPRGRADARPRRQHAHGRHEAEHRRHHQRHGGHRPGGRRAPRWPCKLQGQQRRRLLLLRRRRHQPRRLARRRQLRRVQKLPVVLICNNNQYAYSTPLEPADGLRQRGRPRPGLRHAGRNRGRQRRASRSTRPPQRAVGPRARRRRARTCWSARPSA